MSEMERPTPNSARTFRAYPLAPADLLDAAGRAVEKLPRWSISSRDGQELRAVRTTRLLRFKDDVTVRVEAQEEGSVAVLFSAPRVGSVDFGWFCEELLPDELVKAA